MKKNLIIVLVFIFTFCFSIVVFAEPDVINEEIIEETEEISQDEDVIEQNIDTIDDDNYYNVPEENIIFIPDKPTGLQSSIDDAEKVTITWNDQSDATHYNIYLDGAKIGYSMGSIFNIENLEPGRVYYVYVKAVNSAGVSDASEIIEIYKNVLDKVSNLRIENVTDNTAYIKWDGSGIYDIFLNDEFIGSTLGNNSYKITGLESDSNYRLNLTHIKDSRINTSITFSTDSPFTNDIESIVNDVLPYIRVFIPYFLLSIAIVITYMIMQGTLDILGNIWS